MEGIKYGFPDIVKEHKQAYAQELVKKRAVEYRDRMVLRQQLSDDLEHRRIAFESCRSKLRELERIQREQILMYKYKVNSYDLL